MYCDTVCNHAALDSAAIVSGSLYKARINVVELTIVLVASSKHVLLRTSHLVDGRMSYEPFIVPR